MLIFITVSCFFWFKNKIHLNLGFCRQTDIFGKSRVIGNVFGGSRLFSRFFWNGRRTLHCSAPTEGRMWMGRKKGQSLSLVSWTRE